MIYYNINFFFQKILVVLQLFRICRICFKI
ncbi:hypothetical protein [Campylobacter phage CJLB-14]|nr:hypothetical protein [Campylobacter phage CJLB-14]